MTPIREKSIQEQLDRVRKDLLDLTARNSLISFGRQRVAGLQIVDASCKEVFKSLVVDNGKFAFRHDPQAEEESPAHLGRTNPRKGLQTPYSASVLLRRLRRTHARAREALQETGVNMLFLSLGMLEWYEADSSDRKRVAPLILVPATLDRDDIRGEFHLKYSEEDLGTNRSLQEKLRNDFDIDLPDLPDDIDDTKVEDYFQRVKDVVSGQGIWQVNDATVELGFFSFTKYLMYRDLASENWPDDCKPADHLVLNALLGDGFNPDSAESIARKELDRKFEPGKPSVILDADSSQLLAIIEANDGRNLVVQGPPGTGKSQTIVNILAEAIEQDKKVLFVSEKMAALEVVKRRMDAVGLGVACLELHSNKARKSEVINDLRTTFDLGEPELANIGSVTSSIATDRERLNEYCLAVNTPIGESGVAPVGAIGHIAQIKRANPNIDELELDIHGASDWDEVATERKMGIVGELQAHLSEHGPPSANPMQRSRTVGPPTPNKSQNVRSKERQFSNTLDRLRASAVQLANRLGHPAPTNISDTRKLIALCHLLMDSPDTTGIDIGNPVWARHEDALQYLIDKSRSTLRTPAGQDTRVSPIHAYGRMTQICSAQPDTPSIVEQELDIDGASEWTKGTASRKLKLVERMRAHLQRYGPPSKNPLHGSRTSLHPSYAQIRKIRANQRKLPKATDKLKESSVMLASNLEIPVPESISEVRRLADLCHSLLNAHARSLTSAEDYDLRELNRIRSIYETKGGHFWSFVFKDYRESKKQFINIFVISAEFNYDQVLDTLDKAITLTHEWITFKEDCKSYEQYMKGLTISAQSTNTVVDNQTALQVIENSLMELKIAYESILSDFELDQCSELRFERFSGESIEYLNINVDRLCGSDMEHWISIADYNNVSQGLRREGLATINKYTCNRTIDTVRNNLVNLVEYHWCRSLLDMLDDRSDFYHTASFLQHKLATIVEDYSDFLSVDWLSIGKIHDYLRHWRSSDNSQLVKGVTLSTELISSATDCEDVLNSIKSDLDGLERAYTSILLTLEMDHHEDLEFQSLQNDDWDLLDSKVKKWANGLEDWVNISSYNRFSCQLGDEELKDLLRYIDNWKPDTVGLVALVQYRRYNDLLERAIKERPPLGQFDRSAHEEVIRRFCGNDLGLLRSTKSAVAHRHWMQVDQCGTYGEFNTLRTETRKKRRHLSIKRLLDKAGRAVQKIKPVFMMSPLSVAHYLPPGKISFDLVIFDEASQVEPVDAFGAILRGTSCVVVGDSQQLPPTSFFNRVAKDEEPEENASASDLESILDLFSTQGARNKTLQWHYRSEHESLIAVSNREFYNNRLQVSPSPDASKSESGVQFQHLPDTQYTTGESVNLGEARQVAAAVMKHARSYPYLTLGVAAFSRRQADAIENKLHAMLANDPSLDANFFNSHSAEPFFVKNLESVQGDERDVIFISVGYGKQADGRLRMNFGPLNKKGGERRLNVLISRAKKRCVVFSNITYRDIDLSKTQARGVQALKTYLEFAETGNLDTAQPTGMTAESPFEESVAAELRTRGYRVAEQIGQGSYRIDLAIVDADNTGRYLLGIECDGASYHSSKTARDRDRIRQDTLEKKGWRIHRVWSTDWFYSQDRALERLIDAIEDAKRDARKDDSVASSKTHYVDCEAASATIVRKTVPRNASSASSIPYEVWDRTKQASDKYMYVDTHKDLRDHVVSIVNTEAPVHIFEVRRRIREAYYTSRGLSTAVKQAERDGQIRVEGDFLFCADSRPITVRNRRNLTSTSRKIELVAPEEIQQAILKTVDQNIGIDVDELPIAVADLLGFGRTTERIRRCISEQLELMKAEGRDLEIAGYERQIETKHAHNQKHTHDETTREVLDTAWLLDLFDTEEPDHSEFLDFLEHPPAPKLRFDDFT